MPARKYLKGYFLLLIFLFKSLSGFAQKPPTGGNGLPPLPPSEGNGKSNFPIIYPAIGLGAAGVVYLLTKKHKSQQVIPTESLKNYLLRHYILPTTDAMNLMYLLNPGLNHSPTIPKKFQMKDPDFPELSDAELEQQITSTPRIPKLKISFQEQNSLFKSRLIAFDKLKTSKATTGLAKTFRDDLETIEKNMETTEFIKLADDTLRRQMVTDLFHVLNKVLRQKNTGNRVSEFDAKLVKNISENLNDLLSPPIVQGNTNQQGFRGLKYILDAVKTTYLKIEKNADQLNKTPGKDQSITAIKSFNDQPHISNNLERKVTTHAFAFAIYKLNEAQKPVAKGAEIEGRYFVQYVCPALKDFQDYYHDICPPLASYAGAYLPSAKYYISVRDLNKKPLRLLNPLIDTRDAYENPQRESFKKMIKIPIYIQ